MPVRVVDAGRSADGESMADAAPDDVEFEYHAFGEAGYSWLGFGGALVGLLVLFAMVGPWRRSDTSAIRGDLWIVLQVGLLHALVFVSQQVGTTADSASYWRIPKWLLEGSNAYFPPGYPMFLYGIRQLPLPGMGPSGLAVEWITALQAVLMVAATVGVHRLLRRALPPAVALVAATLIGSMPSYALAGRAILSEGLVMPLAIGILGFSVAAWRNGGFGYAVLAGLCGGIGTVSRVTPVLLAGIAFAWMLWPWRLRYLGLAVVASAVMAAVIAVPVGWFVAHGKGPGLAYSSGGHIYNRLAFGDHYLHAEGEKTRELLGKLEQAGIDPFETDHVKTRWALQQLGMSIAEADELQKAVALEAILHAPVRFGWSCIVQFFRTCWGPPGTAWAGWCRRPREGLVGAPMLGMTGHSLRWMEAAVDVESHGLWWGVNAFGAIGAAWVLVRCRRREPWLLLIAVVVTAGPDACLDIWTNRRTMTLIPYLVPLAVIGVYAIANGFRPYAGGDASRPA